MCHDARRCFIPPHVLTWLINEGRESERARVLATLNTDFGVRTARIHNAKQRGWGPREGADMLATVAPVGPSRIITNARHAWDVTAGDVTRGEGDPPTGDPDTDEAYDGLGATYAFFAQVFGRNSIDDEGMPLRGVVHFGTDYDNAFWDGRRMVFGDGDGFYFRRFTADLDVIAHELGHGVTEDEAGLEYWGEPGALNESLSDVWGALVQQHQQGQTAEEASWLIGDALVDPDNFPGEAIRSMKAPGTAFDGDIQPAHCRDFVRTAEDNGGVHINSGIPNRAFFTIATALGGHGWERAGRIWYEASRDPHLRTTATFKQFARVTVAVAEQLYGDASEETQAVRHGWDTVGLTI